MTERYYGNFEKKKSEINKYKEIKKQNRAIRKIMKEFKFFETMTSIKKKKK